MIKANIRDEIVDLALSQYHKPYMRGSFGEESFDCASLAWYIYKKILNIDIFEEGYGISTTTKIMTSKYGILTLYDENSLSKNLKLINKGDIVFLHRQSKQDCIPRINNKYPGHVGIYLGDLKFIHASGRAKKVIINSFEKEYWNGILVGAKNIVDDKKVYKKSDI